MQKKNIVLFFSGQARMNGLSNNPKKHNFIIDSYNKFIFTKEFKDKYNYKIFISTDDLNIERAIDYFGVEHIGNIHLFNSNYYYKNINTKIPDVDIFLKKYNNSPQWDKYSRYDGSIHQHYKILDCYNLFRNEPNLPCDYMIRLRMDTIFTNNIVPMITMLENNSLLDAFIVSEIFVIGKPPIMNWYFTGLENKYGTYAQMTPSSIFVEGYINQDKFRWTYASEIQFFEMMYEWCINNNLDMKRNIYFSNEWKTACLIDFTDRYKGWKFIENIWDSIIE
jgi:hypothetical protein